MTAHVPLPKTPPDWQTYAAAAIARLRKTQGAPSTPRSPAGFDDDFDGSFDVPKPHTADPHPAPSLADQLEAILASAPGPAESAGSAKIPALPPLDLEQLMLVLQLSGAFGTAAGLQKILPPGALTLIRGFAMRRLDTAETVLRKGFPPEDWAESPRRA